MFRYLMYSIVIIFFIGCQISMPYKKFIQIPPHDFMLAQKKLKSNGYYYLEKSSIDYCKSERYGTGMKKVKNSKYEEKHIEVLVFYTTGQVYHSGSLIISGIKINKENRFDYCHLVKNENSFNKAREKFEYLVTQKYLDEKNGKFNRGVYNIIQNKIKIQVYNSGSEVLQLYEHTGQILNDTTIIINKKKHYPNRTEEVNQIYRFKEFDIKPDSTSYILDNKSEFGN